MLQILWKRKLILLLAIMVTVGASVAYLKYKAPTYKSSALVQVSNAASGQSGNITVDTNLRLLTSQSVAEGAAKILHLPNGTGLAAGISANSDTTNGTVTVVGIGASPQGSQALANAFATSFVGYLQQQSQAHVNSLLDQQKSVAAQLSQLQEQLTAAPANQLVLAQVTGAVQNYTTITNEVGQAQSAPPPAIILNPAALGASTRSTKKTIGIAGLIGLLGGAGLTLIRDQFDTRVRQSGDVLDIIGLPVLAELPVDPDGKRRDDALPAMEKPQSAFSEAVRELRTSLEVLLSDHKCPVIVITSPEPGDGKTFVAANLAVSWALSGKRTVVVAGDIRRNHLDEVFSDEVPSDGLATLLDAEFARLPMTGGTDDLPGSAKGAVAGSPQRLVWNKLWLTEVDRLLILPAGATTKDPADLLASPTTKFVLNELRQLADVVIIDSPPALAVADAAIWGAAADGVVLVVSADKTDQPQLERTGHRLRAAGANLVGVALNRSRSAATTTYRGYYSAARRPEAKPTTRSRAKAVKADLGEDGPTFFQTPPGKAREPGTPDGAKAPAAPRTQR